MQLEAGEKFGEEYTVLGRLGKGGQGTVYEVVDPMGQHWALKVSHELRLADRQAELRFQKEALWVNRLRETLPRNCGVFVGEHYGICDGRLYIKMKLLHGESIAELLSREGQLQVREAAELAHGIASAVHLAHRRSALHRDLKPENVFIETSGLESLAVSRGGVQSNVISATATSSSVQSHAGVSQSTRVSQPLTSVESSERDRFTRVQVMDWGAVQLRELSYENRDTGEFAPVCTPGYAPLEQYESLERRNLKASADVYALGVMLYEMLTGFHPFVGWARCASDVSAAKGTCEGPAPAGSGVLAASLPIGEAQTLAGGIGAGQSSGPGRISQLATPNGHSLEDLTPLVPAPACFSAAGGKAASQNSGFVRTDAMYSVEHAASELETVTLSPGQGQVSARLPPRHFSTLEVLRLQQAVTPPRLQGVPPALAKLVQRMLAKEPAMRPQTMREVADELLSVLEELQAGDGWAEAKLKENRLLMGTALSKIALHEKRRVQLESVGRYAVRGIAIAASLALVFVYRSSNEAQAVSAGEVECRSLALTAVPAVLPGSAVALEMPSTAFPQENVSHVEGASPRSAVSTPMPAPHTAAATQKALLGNGAQETASIKTLVRVRSGLSRGKGLNKTPSLKRRGSKVKAKRVAPKRRASPLVRLKRRYQRIQG